MNEHVSGLWVEKEVRRTVYVIGLGNIARVLGNCQILIKFWSSYEFAC